MKTIKKIILFCFIICFSITLICCSVTPVIEDIPPIIDDTPPIIDDKEDNKNMGVMVGVDMQYKFDVKQDGLYKIKINYKESSLDIKKLDKNVVYSIDNGYTTRLKSKNSANSIIDLGTKYLLKDEHILFINNCPSQLVGSDVVTSLTEVYDIERLELSQKWMDTLYVETGVNTTKPNYLGYVETKGWQDIWTHCQYLPYSMFVATQFKSEEYNRRVKTIADNLLIKKMYKSSGEVNTIYRADDDIFQVSIEPDMPTNKYELWRGNAAFSEEMINCYLYFKEDNYLNYAKKAMDYIISNWSTTQVDGHMGNFYSRYSNSPNASIDIMSTGRATMVFSQLYFLTKEQKYKSAAISQAKILLASQENQYSEFDGLFASAVSSSGKLNEFRHGNAYANAMLGLAWVYKITGEKKYLNAIDKGIKVLDKVYDDELGMIIVVDGKALRDNPSTGPAYMAGRIGQAVMTCAKFTNKIDYFKQGERVLEFALGRNYGNHDMQNTENGWYYYSVGYNGMSNSETSCEIYLAQMQYYYLSKIWNL